MQPIIAGQSKAHGLPARRTLEGIERGKETSGIPHAGREYPTYKGR
jgi:hypothetical protein